MPAPKSSGVLDYPNLETRRDRVPPDNPMTVYTGLATTTLRDEPFTCLVVLVATETAPLTTGEPDRIADAVPAAWGGMIDRLKTRPAPFSPWTARRTS
jgi:hypothetical protein